MSGNLKLEQTIVSGAIRATNFFNGRLISAEDLTREQTARREADNRLGQAHGHGIAFGLTVAKARSSTQNELTVTVEKGLAVNRAGQTLRLAETATLNLLHSAEQNAPDNSTAKNGFARCQPLVAGTRVIGFGLYLLVITSAQQKQGLAQSGGLPEVSRRAACDTDQIIEAVRFRLVAVDPFLAGERMPAAPLVQNYLAHLCFGTLEINAFADNPLGFSLEKYGLLDEMQAVAVTDCDVPLALINLTGGAVQFVDNWAVRRTLTNANGETNWTALTGARRAAESAAALAQFAEQTERLQIETANLNRKTAQDFFRFLPAAGVVPIASNVAPGFDLKTFFAARGSNDVALLEAERLPTLLTESLRHSPVDLQNTERRIQLYLIGENVRAFQTGAAQLALVFAKHSLPYFGTARFNQAKFDLSRFVRVN